MRGIITFCIIGFMAVLIYRVFQLKSFSAGIKELIDIKDMSVWNFLSMAMNAMLLGFVVYTIIAIFVYAFVLVFPSIEHNPFFEEILNQFLSVIPSG